MNVHLFLQLSETNSGPTFCVKDPGLNGGYGGVLRKKQIVRADQAVEAEEGLLNLQRGGGPGVGVRLEEFGLGWPMRSGVNDAESAARCVEEDH